MKRYVIKCIENDGSEKEEINKIRKSFVSSESENENIKPNILTINNIVLVVSVARIFYRDMRRFFTPPKFWNPEYSCCSLPDGYYYIKPIGDKFSALLNNGDMILKVSSEIVGVVNTLLSLKSIILLSTRSKGQLEHALAHYDALYNYAENHPDKDLIFALSS